MQHCWWIMVDIYSAFPCISQLQQSSGVGAATCAGFWFWAEELQRSSCWFDIARKCPRQGGPSGGRALLWSSQWILLKTSCLGSTSSAWRLWNCQMCAGLPQNSCQDFNFGEWPDGCWSVEVSTRVPGHFKNRASLLWSSNALEFLELCNYVKYILWSSEVSLRAVLFWGQHKAGPFLHDRSERLQRNVSLVRLARFFQPAAAELLSCGTKSPIGARWSTSDWKLLGRPSLVLWQGNIKMPSY